MTVTRKFAAKAYGEQVHIAEFHDDLPGGRTLCGLYMDAERDTVYDGRPEGDLAECPRCVNRAAKLDMTIPKKGRWPK